MVFERQHRKFAGFEPNCEGVNHTRFLVDRNKWPTRKTVVRRHAKSSFFPQKKNTHKEIYVYKLPMPPVHLAGAPLSFETLR